MPLTSSGSPMMSAIVMRGLSDEIRVLEDHLHLPAQRPQLVARQAGDVDLAAFAGAESDRAVGRRDGPQDAARGGGLAAAGFADQRQRLAAGDLERHVIDGPHLPDDAPQEAAADRKVLLQPLHRQDDARPTSLPKPRRGRS